MRVEEYIQPDGSNPYKEWFDSLDSKAAAKVTVATIRLEMGNTSSIKWFGGVGEYTIDWGSGYRIYLAKDGQNLIILFGGGRKRRQQSEIKHAKKLHEQYKERKRIEQTQRKKER